VDVTFKKQAKRDTISDGSCVCQWTTRPVSHTR